MCNYASIKSFNSISIYFNRNYNLNVFTKKHFAVDALEQAERNNFNTHTTKATKIITSFIYFYRVTDTTNTLYKQNTPVPTYKNRHKVKTYAASTLFKIYKNRLKNILKSVFYASLTVGVLYWYTSGIHSFSVATVYLLTNWQMSTSNLGLYQFTSGLSFIKASSSVQKLLWTEESPLKPVEH